MEIKNTMNKKIGIGVGVALLLGIVFFTLAKEGKTASPLVSNKMTSPISPDKKNILISTTLPVDTKKKNLYKYKDGVYSATGSYMSPGGLDKIGVTLTLSSDKVTDVSLDLQPGDNTSRKYQNIFAKSYKQYVVSKNISTLFLNKVSKSSLTSRGFNDAIAKIKLQAKA